jgi:tetrahydromethanopterin S-methyltransferase subunit F
MHYPKEGKEEAAFRQGMIAGVLVVVILVIILSLIS